MVAKKPRIVIIGAGMAGLAAANKLHSAAADSIDLAVVEGGTRIGGRINTSEFCGDRIEMGATWIHGIGGSPIHAIARRRNFLHSDQPWEGMDGSSVPPPTTVVEGGAEPDPTLVRSVTTLFENLMAKAQGKDNEREDFLSGDGEVSVGAFLRRGLEAYWAHQKGTQNEDESRKVLEEAVFAVHENIQRTYTSAGDLSTLDYKAESEYQMFAGEEITIAKGYISIIESLASILPRGLIQFEKKVNGIEWQQQNPDPAGGFSGGPVKLNFSDGTATFADHVIVTVSLGVLKADSGMFSPPLPISKAKAIKNLGFGVVNKLFLELAGTDQLSDQTHFPFLQMAFHRPESDRRDRKIPPWMRKTATLWPIYKNSKVLLSWFAGEEALALELLPDSDVINGLSAAISSFLPKTHLSNSKSSNGFSKKIDKIVKSQWGRDPLFLGSYSYVAVGSSGDDLDEMAASLPTQSTDSNSKSPPLQILFAGEATHRTHYSTTHGAYLSGLREANRLLQHYQFCVGV